MAYFLKAKSPPTTPSVSPKVEAGSRADHVSPLSKCKERENSSWKRPLPLRVRKLSESEEPEFRDPGTPLSLNRYQYTTYTTRYNWKLEHRAKPCKISDFHAEKESAEETAGTENRKRISTNYTIFKIRPRSRETESGKLWDKSETNYRTSYRTRATNIKKGGISCWYTTAHIWSTNTKIRSPSLSPVRRLQSIEKLKSSKMSPRRFSL